MFFMNSSYLLVYILKDLWMMLCGICHVVISGGGRELGHGCNKTVHKLVIAVSG